MTASTEQQPRPYMSPETIRFGNAMLAVEGVLLFCGVAAAVIFTMRDARRARRNRDHEL